MSEIAQLVAAALGLDVEPRELHFLQLLLRTFVVFFATLAMIRVAGRRFLARRNPFDVLLGFIMASMLSRAINGSAPFFGTLGAGFFVAGLHRLLTYWACKSHTLGRWIKGEPETLVENGQLRRDAMQRHHISEHDLLEDMRLKAALSDTNEVKAAQLERNGEISVQRKPHVANIAVQKDVQTVHVQIEG